MVNLNLSSRFFSREDESPDENFYAAPRFTTHIDDSTITNITEYYREVLKPGDRLLDLMSSWISHLPNEIGYQHVCGLGMNEKELERNPRLNDFQVQNLNKSAKLPYDNNSFDAVMIVVSIQYLTNPADVFSEIDRILAPGGKCIVAMSHRLFPTKAVYGFQMLPPADRCQLVSNYMTEANKDIHTEVIDRSPPNADPLWLVVGTKPK
jgi:ubiquinone/menaquinone biosynthesis C-methylase UbiE